MISCPSAQSPESLGKGRMTKSGGGPSGRRKAAGDQRRAPYERLKQAIISGELKPGEPLVEIPLADWCQVSRTPIREALTRLEQDGLARRTDRGLVVRESSPDEIMDLYEARIVLESKVAAVAAERRTTFDLFAMKRAEQKFDEALAEGDALAERNRDFHRSVWVASHNRALVDLLERLDMHLGRYPETTLRYPGRHEVAVQDHQSIVEAIEARDSDRASHLATEHFVAARDIRLKLWASD
jgi:DNA-binding GntR family transcriptional regulator